MYHGAASNFLSFVVKGVSSFIFYIVTHGLGGAKIKIYFC